MKKTLLLFFIFSSLFITDCNALLSSDTEEKLFYFFDKEKDSKYINDNFGWFNYDNKYDNNINFSILVKSGLEVIFDNKINTKNFKDKNILPLISIKNGETDIGGIFLFVSSREINVLDLTNYILEKMFKTVLVSYYSKTINNNIVDTFSVNKKRDLFIVSRLIKNGQNYYFYFFANSSLKNYLMNKIDFGIMLNSFFIKNISKSKFAFDVKKYNYKNPFNYSFYYPKKWVLKNNYVNGDNNISLEIKNNDKQIFYIGSADLKTSVETIVNDIFENVKKNINNFKLEKIDNDNLLINDDSAIFNLFLIDNKDNAIAELYGKIITLNNKRFFIFLVNNIKEENYFLHYENKRVLDIILDSITINN